jgi:hypothetical protein
VRSGQVHTNKNKFFRRGFTQINTDFSHKKAQKTQSEPRINADWHGFCLTAEHAETAEIFLDTDSPGAAFGRNQKN